MLTYEALIEQAKLRGMPPEKIRGILREYLQILILKEICRAKFGRKLYFTGGTYLRLVHNIKRFSEDLDFYAISLTKKDFESGMERVTIELKRLGIVCRLNFAHWDNMYVSKLFFHTIEKFYNVVSKYSKKSGIVIKIEANSPKWKIKSKTEVISGFGEFYPSICTDRGVLFSDKIDALIKKNIARHLYDIMFMLSNRYVIDKDILAALGIRGDPLDIIIGRVKRFSKTDLKKQAESLRPFLFSEDEADLLINAKDIIPSLVEQYRATLKKTS
jgi:predicted nucleotidyltransferase component of viral defense system